MNRLVFMVTILFSKFISCYQWYFPLTRIILHESHKEVNRFLHFFRFFIFYIVISLTDAVIFIILLSSPYLSYPIFLILFLLLNILFLLSYISICLTIFNHYLCIFFLISSQARGLIQIRAAKQNDCLTALIYMPFVQL